MSIRGDSDNDNGRDRKEGVTKATAVPKSHCMTVCIVPPTTEGGGIVAWERLTKARTELKDPGLFRWPPHINLLYPFVDISNTPLSVSDGDGDDDVAAADNDDTAADRDNVSNNERSILEKLTCALEKCKPFHISLQHLGTFGGKHRGVLYMYPNSSWGEEEEKEDHPRDGAVVKEPLVQLQSTLQEELPEFPDQLKNGKFTPHITLSHFPSLEDALEAQVQIESWWKALNFQVKEVHVLKRVGDDGQFKILCTLPLGKTHRLTTTPHDELKEIREPVGCSVR